MSVKQMAVVWELDIGQTEKLLLLALADHADHEGNRIYPSVGRLAWKTGLSKRTVQYSLKALRDDLKLIELVRAGGGRGNPSEYRLTLENGAPLAPFNPKRVQEATQKGAPVAPESSIESSDTPSGQAAPASLAEWDKAKTGEKQAYLIAYIHSRHVERDLEPPTPRQKQRLSGELRTHIQRGAAKADLLFALDKIVEARRRGVALELYQALSDDAQQRLRVLDGGKNRPAEPTRPRKRVIS